jgi:hypothetical protein
MNNAKPQLSNFDAILELGVTVLGFDPQMAMVGLNA